jgi:hypothetical protein
MRYFKRLVTITGLSFSLTTSYCQQQTHDYFFQEVGWTITLPYDFALLDLNDYSINMEDEQQNVEEDMSTGVVTPQTMFIAIKDRFNHFNITITPFDIEEDGNWFKTNQSVKDQAYKTMVKILGGEKPDSSSSIEYIDGLAFEKFHIAATIDKDLRLDMFLLSRWYRGYDFCMSFLSVNDETRKQIELMLKSSRFE